MLGVITVTSYAMRKMTSSFQTVANVPLSTTGLVAIILVPQRVEITDELVERSED